MSNSQPTAKLTTEELVDRFAAIGIAQDEALLDNEIAKFNRLYRKKVAIETELRDRPGDQRRQLMALYDHPNMQVRLNAAKATRAIDMKKARALLEAITTSKHYPQAGDAGMALVAMDDGTYKLDGHLPPKPQR
ncbi:DUF2019 domain-containing protein [Nitratireductor pacificus]|uniref:DUF2019 domain-containing protein n=1 Tax=Nitratireductor pacificus pht-3B TaxID=391937 RepID=K2MTP9_9HYPH|nr:DUF2019 domain-containing protein [Nitratireductor pacificus]EKF20757.1 hypothetical protein NA2_00225 [Nitratireductor pacificus pht-3B]